VQKSAGLGRIRKRKKGDLEVEQHHYYHNGANPFLKKEVTIEFLYSSNFCPIYIGLVYI
jgi:hypothetical protein